MKNTKLTVVEDHKNQTHTIQGIKRDLVYTVKVAQGQGCMRKIEVSKGAVPKALSGLYQTPDRAVAAIQNYEDGVHPSAKASEKDVKKTVAAQKEKEPASAAA